ncbi:MAG: 5-(carboxyamino)imidazole ribonucleotide mutase, partial [Methyloversatilis sp. 12-65-5]
MSASEAAQTPRVGVVMGSNSDWDTLRAATALLEL